MPMVIDTDSDPERIKPADIYHTNMHKPVIAQHAAFITAFDTELSMEGIFTFLENTIGHYAPEIIRAFRAVGHEEDAEVLEEICRLAPPDAMRGEWTEKEYQQYDITSFDEDHALRDEAAERIEQSYQRIVDVKNKQGIK